MAAAYLTFPCLLLLICYTLCSTFSSASTEHLLDVSAKCPNIVTPSSLKRNSTRHNSTLRVVVPWKVDFEQFVSFSPYSCRLDGFSVQVFLQALNYMQYPLRRPQYQFVLYGAGDQTPHYNDMIDMLVREEVDAVVADLTITAERMEKVGFTVPYLASSLAMLTPFSYGSNGALWDFLKPFSRNLWIFLLFCFLATGGLLYFLEDQNPDFAITSKKRDSSKQKREASTSNPMPANTSPPSSPSNSTHDPPQALTCNTAPVYGTPPLLSLPNNSNNLINDDISSLQRSGLPIYDQASHKRRVMNAYWFTSLCIFQAQQESVRTHLGRIVTITWLFVMLIFISSYTASLASLLSAQKRYPTVVGFQALKKDVNISVGYQETSFIETFVKKLHMEGHRLKSFTSERGYAEALRKGNLDPDGIGVVLDELPYIRVVLQSVCSFTMISAKDDNLPSFGGFGFAFRKGDPLMDQMSKMILAMAEDGTLQKLQNGWNVGDDTGAGECDANDDPSHLRLRSFGGLFSIVACVYMTCIIWRLSCKAIKSPQGSCITVMDPASTIPRWRERSQIISKRHSNRVTDESGSDRATSQREQPITPNYPGKC